ncbi:hypothetical protein Tco_0887172 [Tanacetum coccineum]
MTHMCRSPYRPRHHQTTYLARGSTVNNPYQILSVPIYPEYMPQEDEVFPAEEQPLLAAASPTTQSPDYVPESDPEADP